MKKALTLLFAIVTIQVSAQDIHYFEFTTDCDGIWQDTSFIAAATDQALVDTVLAELLLPMEQRRFISGSIDYGDGSYNHNGDHWFLWHFIPDEWLLTEMSIEVCDGCPHSDVDQDTAYWVGNLGVYCPWSGKPSREILDPAGLQNVVLLTPSVYPNPANDRLYLHASQARNGFTMYNLNGDIVLSSTSPMTKTIDLSPLDPGIYFFHSSGRVEKVVILR